MCLVLVCSTTVASTRRGNNSTLCGAMPPLGVQSMGQTANCYPVHSYHYQCGVEQSPQSYMVASMGETDRDLACTELAGNCQL
jgi:hypothetical protein